jgi:hypothetical protein
MGYWWEGLSDDELASRLEHRGLDADKAGWLVRHRDDDGTLEAIEAVLD